MSPKGPPSFFSRRILVENVPDSYLYVYERGDRNDRTLNDATFFQPSARALELQENSNI